MTTRPMPWLCPSRLALWVALPMARTSEVERRLTMILDTTRSRRQTTRRILFTTLALGAAVLLPLAALRPAARAQTAAAAPASPAVPQEAGIMAAPGGQSVPVELAGVTDQKTPGGQWWSASGTPLARPVFDAVRSYLITSDDPKQRGLVFAFRLPRAARNVTAVLRALDSPSSSSGGGWPGKVRGQENVTEATLGGDTGGARILSALYPASAAKASLRVGIAAGTWRKAAIDFSSETKAPETKVYDRAYGSGTSFLFSPAAETKDGPVITITTSGLKDDVRVVAVDRQGREVLPAAIGDNSSGTLDQITARFRQPLSQIKAFRVETRPFTWTDFKDVALQPVK